MSSGIEQKIHDNLNGTVDLVKQLINENARMRAALLKAAGQFNFYVEQHLAKVPPDEAKASTNIEWAEHCREAAKHD
jgi:hypothetical protein